MNIRVHYQKYLQISISKYLTLKHILKLTKYKSMSKRNRCL